MIYEFLELISNQSNNQLVILFYLENFTYKRSLSLKTPPFVGWVSYPHQNSKPITLFLRAFSHEGSFLGLQVKLSKWQPRGVRHLCKCTFLPKQKHFKFLKIKFLPFIGFIFLFPNATPAKFQAVRCRPKQGFPWTQWIFLWNKNVLWQLIL